MTYLDCVTEGQRFCQLGKFDEALNMFEKALYKVGPSQDKSRTRVVYSYLGNIHYCLGQYGRSMEYHRQDLKITQALGDTAGQSEALNNLSCALRMLGKYNEAGLAAEKQLVLAQRLHDKSSEATARYNAGLVYYTQGRHVANESDDTVEAYNCFIKAQEYLQEYLLLAEDLKNTKMQGQASGCLGNTFYLMGNYSKALYYYRKRLMLATAQHDKVAERRAYCNLALCHALLAQFKEATDYWRKFLVIAVEQNDLAAQGQAFYCLGNNYSILGNYRKAAEYYLKHQSIAEKLGDRVGEGRTYWMLSNVYANCGQLKRALEYAHRFYELASEMEDCTAQATAQMMISEIGNFLGVDVAPDGSVEEPLVSKTEFSRQRRHSINEQRQLPAVPPETPWVSEPHIYEDVNEPQGLRAKNDKFSESELSVRTVEQSMQSVTSHATHQSMQSVRSHVTGQSMQSVRSTNAPSNYSGMSLNEDFFDLLHRHIATRYEDQRGPLPVVKEEVQAKSPPPRPKTPIKPKPKRDNLNNPPMRTFSQMPPISQNLIAGCPPSRQYRKVAPQDRSSDLSLTTRPNGQPNGQYVPSHIKDTQQILANRAVSEVSATDSEESFFQLISRMQGNRLDDQRSSGPHRTRLYN